MYCIINYQVRCQVCNWVTVMDMLNFNQWYILLYTKYDSVQQYNLVYFMFFWYSY